MLTPSEKAAVVAEVFDQQKIQLVCGKHGYLGSNKVPEPKGCKNCWQAYYMYMLGTTPPGLRKQRVEEIYQVLRRGVEAFEKGQWDFEPFDRVILETSRES